jgi:outer membrane receptor protein involved in Fe transport
VHYRIQFLLAGVGILAFAAVTNAQTAKPGEDAADAPAAQSTAGVEEIIVTARRRPESLQDVPETISVVKGDTLQQLELFHFEDIQDIVPGLQLSNQHNGYETTASMRGVTYSEDSATPPTVQFYLNDAPFDSNSVFQSMYDVGQIEVLRGPTGTVRGVISPSGSITLTTRRPDLEDYGGYFDATVGSLNDTNFQGAFGMPIIPGKFAIRIAGSANEDQVNYVTSLNNPALPRENNYSGRITALLQPNDDSEVLLTYQSTSNSQTIYSGFGGSAIYGTGAPGALGGIVPANFNGPPISADENVNLAQTATATKQKIQQLIANAHYDFLGQRLSYVGSYEHFSLEDRLGSDPTNSLPGNFISPGSGVFQTSPSNSNELRLSSVEWLFRRFEYTIGFFRSNTPSSGVSIEPPSFLAGAFGPPTGAPAFTYPNLRYALGDSSYNSVHSHEFAGYASLTWHIDDATEITAGVRHGEETKQLDTNTVFGTAYQAIPGLPGPTCTAYGGQFGVGYPGICDFPVSVPPILIHDSESAHPTIYNVEVSHKWDFADGLTTYARTASSYTLPNIQVATADLAATYPALSPFIYLKPQTSKEYEFGIKSEFLNHKLLFDIDYYRQNWRDLFYETQPFYFYAVSAIPGSAPTVSSAVDTFVNAPAVVNGVEGNVSYRPIPAWTMSSEFSYAKGHIENTRIPCNPPANAPTEGGVPTVGYFQQLGAPYNTCTSNASTTTAPLWNVTFNTEYHHSLPLLSGNLEGFARGLLYYYPDNPNASIGYTVRAYAIGNLYLGVRDRERSWAATFYVKNIGGDNNITSKNSTQVYNYGANFFGSTGYFYLTHTAPREYGLTLHYTFGSR